MEEILRKLQKEASGSKHRAIKESCTWAIGKGGGRGPPGARVGAADCGAVRGSAGQALYRRRQRELGKLVLPPAGPERLQRLEGPGGSVLRYGFGGPRSSREPLRPALGVGVVGLPRQTRVSVASGSLLREGCVISTPSLLSVS